MRQAVERSSHLLRLDAGARPAADAARRTSSRSRWQDSSATTRTCSATACAGWRWTRRSPSSSIEASSVVELLDTDPLELPAAARALDDPARVDAVAAPGAAAVSPAARAARDRARGAHRVRDELRQAQRLRSARHAARSSTRTIFQEYEYKQGATTVFTTPFEVYVQPPRRVPGLHEPVHLPGAPARRAGPLRVRLHLHGAASTPTSARARPPTPGCRSTCPRSAGRASTRRTGS